VFRFTEPNNDNWTMTSQQMKAFRKERSPWLAHCEKDARFAVSFRAQLLLLGLHTGRFNAEQLCTLPTKRSDLCYVILAINGEFWKIARFHRG
jgi:hypothetical protein